MIERKAKFCGLVQLSSSGVAYFFVSHPATILLDKDGTQSYFFLDI